MNLKEIKTKYISIIHLKEILQIIISIYLVIIVKKIISKNLIIIL